MLSLFFECSEKSYLGVFVCKNLVWPLYVVYILHIMCNFAFLTIGGPFLYLKSCFSCSVLGLVGIYVVYILHIYPHRNSAYELQHANLLGIATKLKFLIDKSCCLA